jgi:hypothetical protein
MVCADLCTFDRGVVREYTVSQSFRNGWAAVEHDRHEKDYAAATSELATITARVSGGASANWLQDAIELRRFKRGDRFRGRRIRIAYLNAAERDGIRREVSEVQLVRHIRAASARECGRLKRHPHLELRRRETRRDGCAGRLGTCSSRAYEGSPEDHHDP